MKLINAAYEPTKEILFHGITLLIEHRFKYVAADKSGEVYVYMKKPYLVAREASSRLRHTWRSIDHDFEQVASVDLEGMDWKDTLVEVAE